MITNLILMNGFGIYIWSSFGIAIVACLLLYLKTRKVLRKYEKNFAVELEQLSVEERKMILEKSKIANQVLASQNKTF
jgi:heme exporter protein D|tara:strand:- start:263 stop:496 length:234 start_codon:yes stop_codon:yes gene_type:complete